MKRIVTLMQRAYETDVLIPAFNAAYPEMVKPICDTLKRQAFSDRYGRGCKTGY